MIAKYGSSVSMADLSAAWTAGADSAGALARALQARFGVRHAAIYGSGRAALRAILRAAVSDGAVALPAYTCIAVPEAVTAAGLRPVFADLAPASVNMSAETLEACLVPGVRAAMLTHQFGIPCEMRALVELCRQRGLFVIEDAAAALGARMDGRWAGTMGDAAVLSFGLTKVAGAGHLGAVLTDSDSLADRLEASRPRAASPFAAVADLARAAAWSVAMRPGIYGMLRRGWGAVRASPLHEVVIPESATGEADAGGSSCAARLARAQLERLDVNLEARRARAAAYGRELAGCADLEVCSVPAGAEPAWMQYPVFTARKEHVYRFLLRRGVDLNWTFRYSCGESYEGVTTPRANLAARCVLGLPCYPELPLEQVRRIAGLIREAVRA